MARKRSPGRKPFGYSKSEQEVIEVIVRKRRKRRGSAGPTPYNAIAVELNTEGYRTRDGKYWRAKQVRKILNSRAHPLFLPTSRVKKTQLSPGDYLTPEQIAACRSTFKNDYEERIFETLLGSALRASELCALQVRDVYLDAEPYQIEVRRGKGSKQRVVVIGSELAGILRQYLKTRQPQRKEPLLLNSQGDPLRYKALYAVIKAVGTRAKIPSLHPHTLRHTWATLCNYETSCFDIADQLGHSRLSTTAIYRKVRIQQRIRTAAAVEQQINSAASR